MSSSGTVVVWHVEEGWGVIESPATPDGCWVHLSAVLVDGFRELRGPGPDPDTEVVRGPSSGYASTLTITVDDQEEPR